MGDTTRNFLAEAYSILEGRTHRLAEKRHLEALASAHKAELVRISNALSNIRIDLVLRSRGVISPSHENYSAIVK